MKITVEFEGITKSVNFTEPQARIMQRLNRGEHATMVNTHYMSGGDFVWKEQSEEYGCKEFVGYRAFSGAMTAIIRAFNLDRDAEKRLYNKYIN
ncbi:hypothetical protein I6E23_05675 [Prevotella brevis]|nr:hypothetical protein [Xylanibacter brevis]